MPHKNFVEQISKFLIETHMGGKGAKRNLIIQMAERLIFDVGSQLTAHSYHLAPPALQ